jgi:hypothetical protein
VSLGSGAPLSQCRLKHRNLSRVSAWTASARGFKDLCLTGTSVSVWWCAFCAMKCATQKLDSELEAVQRVTALLMACKD